MKCKERIGEVRRSGKSRDEHYVRPFSMPFTAALATVRSTAFTASFIGSIADFCIRSEVEKAALGVRRSVRRVVVDVRVRKDMMSVV